MSAIDKDVSSQAASIDSRLPKCWFERFHRNERGTTLTEFLITLPIFILIFVSMVKFGQFELTAGKLWAHAYQETWSNVLPVSERQVVPLDSSHEHGNPYLAGLSSKGQLGTHAVHNRISEIESTIKTLEPLTYTGLQQAGHWGESYERVQPVAEYFDFGGAGSHLTSQPAGIVGNSSYARTFVDDSGGMVSIPGVGSGTSAAVGAGIRYGTVFGLGKIEPVIMGVTMPMYVHFNVLVAPMPYNDSRKTIDSIHRLMIKQPQYEHLLGISMSQPLTGVNGSLNVPEIE